MSDTRTYRNWLIAGLVILIILTAICVYSAITFLPRKQERPQLEHRYPIPTLTYCGAESDELCIVSFSQEVDGGLQVVFQTPSRFFPDFLLKINRNGEESTYACQRTEANPTNVICTGKSQAPGEILQFRVFYKNANTPFAEGNIVIIGIALVTPEAISTATVETPFITETPTELPTPMPLPRTPTPSYPNPSYPNPSYP